MAEEQNISQCITRLFKQSLTQAEIYFYRQYTVCAVCVHTCSGQHGMTCDRNLRKAKCPSLELCELFILLSLEKKPLCYLKMMTKITQDLKKTTRNSLVITGKQEIKCMNA